MSSPVSARLKGSPDATPRKIVDAESSGTTSSRRTSRFSVIKTFSAVSWPWTIDLACRNCSASPIGPDDGQGFVERQRRNVVEHEAQRGAVEKLHDEVAEFPVVVDVEVRDDIRVRAGAQHRVAQLELAEEPVVQGDPVRQQLERYPAADAEFPIPFVVGFVNVAEPAAADPCVQAIATGDQAPFRFDCLLLVAEFQCGHRKVRKSGRVAGFGRSRSRQQ